MLLQLLYSYVKHYCEGIMQFFRIARYRFKYLTYLNISETICLNFGKDTYNLQRNLLLRNLQ